MKKVKNFLKKKFPNGIQGFNTRNIAGDSMITIYHKNNITIEYCPYYEYIEIFGINEMDFLELIEEKYIYQ